MGGSSPVKKVKKELKRQGTEGVIKTFSKVMNPAGWVSPITKELGVKTDLIFDPAGTTAGEVGQKVVDDPAKAKKQAKELAQSAAKAQKAQLAEIKGRKAQSAAEEEASKTLTKTKARQRRRSKGKGRRSTILTDKTGVVGGAAGTGRKTLLGL